MLRDLSVRERDDAVKGITERLTDLTHDRHIHCQECSQIGLNIEMLEAPIAKSLQDKVLTVHHCFMHALSNTPAFKIIEDHRGGSFIKLQQ